MKGPLLSIHPNPPPAVRWWLPWAAAAIALPYALQKLYWALGGHGLRSTIGFPHLSGAQEDAIVAWSLFLYSPWFLIWGLLLGVVGLQARRGRTEPGVSVRRSR